MAEKNHEGFCSLEHGGIFCRACDLATISAAPPPAGAQQAVADELLVFVKKIANGEVKDHMFTSLEDEASSLWFRASAQLSLARKS